MSGLADVPRGTVLPSLTRGRPLHRRPKASTRYRLPPAVRCIQKVTLYETKSRYYLVGSDENEKYFRVLKIDRTSPRELRISEDGGTYSALEIQALLDSLRDGNKSAGGLTKTQTAHGVLGFIRFLEGYYILLITASRQVGVIGRHVVYSVEETGMVYIPHPSVRIHNVDEGRYTSIFTKMELAHNFFFSFTYDLTHSLQYNMTRHRRTQLHPVENGAPPHHHDTRWSDSLFHGFPYQKHFVWNIYLMKDMWPRVQEKGWCLPVIHGFFSQSKVSVFGRNLMITIIARRSRHYAGTRYLKRGLNEYGRAGNEVETEQIVHDSTTSHHDGGHFSALVTLRGSIPVFWFQDQSVLAPKPPIQVKRVDPFYTATTLHFQDLHRRYGNPVMVISLIKSSGREEKLGKEFRNAVRHINRELPEDMKVEYIAWDMHLASKGGDVIQGITDIAARIIAKTGFFHAGYAPHRNVLQEGMSNNPVPAVGGIPYPEDGLGREQCGIGRLNCIDSLDRTNAAQFCLGKLALGHQLYAMGLADSIHLGFDSPLMNTLTRMYEDMGDHIALQYGGSQLNHKIATYRNNTWAARTRDMVTAVRRYYSNSFTDAEKQEAMNIFLGLFVPKDGQEPIWNIGADFFLHNSVDPRFIPSGLRRSQAPRLNVPQSAYIDMTPPVPEAGWWSSVREQFRDGLELDAPPTNWGPLQLAQPRNQTAIVEEEDDFEEGGQPWVLQTEGTSDDSIRRLAFLSASGTAFGSSIIAGYLRDAIAKSWTDTVLKRTATIALDANGDAGSVDSSSTNDSLPGLVPPGSQAAHADSAPVVTVPSDATAAGGGLGLTTGISSATAEAMAFSIDEVESNDDTDSESGASAPAAKTQKPRRTSDPTPGEAPPSAATSVADDTSSVASGGRDKRIEMGPVSDSGSSAGGVGGAVPVSPTKRSSVPRSGSPRASPLRLDSPREQRARKDRRDRARRTGMPRGGLLSFPSKGEAADEGEDDGCGVAASPAVPAAPRAIPGGSRDLAGIKSESQDDMKSEYSATSRGGTPRVSSVPWNVPTRVRIDSDSANAAASPRVAGSPRPIDTSESGRAVAARILAGFTAMGAGVVLGANATQLPFSALLASMSATAAPSPTVQASSLAGTSPSGTPLSPRMALQTPVAGPLPIPGASVLGAIGAARNDHYGEAASTPPPSPGPALSADVRADTADLLAAAPQHNPVASPALGSDRTQTLGAPPVPPVSIDLPDELLRPVGHNRTASGRREPRRREGSEASEDGHVPLTRLRREQLHSPVVRDAELRTFDTVIRQGTEDPYFDAFYHTEQLTSFDDVLDVEEKWAVYTTQGAGDSYYSPYRSPEDIRQAGEGATVIERLGGVTEALRKMRVMRPLPATARPAPPPRIAKRSDGSDEPQEPDDVEATYNVPLVNMREGHKDFAVFTKHESFESPVDRMWATSTYDDFDCPAAGFENQRHKDADFARAQYYDRYLSNEVGPLVIRMTDVEDAFGINGARGDFRSQINAAASVWEANMFNV